MKGKDRSNAQRPLRHVGPKNALQQAAQLKQTGNKHRSKERQG